MKLRPIKAEQEGVAEAHQVALGTTIGWEFYCPGCQDEHVFWVEGNLKWSFDGDMENPSFSPSLKNTWNFRNQIPDECCHLVLTKGVLNFCSDCTHAHANKVVPLEELKS